MNEKAKIFRKIISNTESKIEKMRDKESKDSKKQVCLILL